MSEQLPKKVLIVDSDATIAGPLNDPLEKMGIELFSAADLQTALYRFNTQFFPVVFVELRFPELDGLAIVQKWRGCDIEDKRTAGFVLLTSSTPTKEQISLIKEMGQLALVPKPLKAATMISQIQKAYQVHTRQRLTRKIKFDILNKLEKSGDVRVAIEQVKEFKNPLGSDYLPMLLELYQRSEMYADGIAVLQKLPSDAMDPLRRLNMLGKLHLKMGKIEEARTFFEQADAIAPRNMERIKDMTQVYLKLKCPDEAIEKQRELLGMNPDTPDMKFDMFKQLEDEGFMGEAAEFCRETSGPKEVVRYFNNKGVVMAQTREPKEAIDEYLRALSYYPKNTDNYLIHFNLALAYLRTRKAEGLVGAKQHLDDCLNLRPDFQKAQELLDKLISKAG